MLMKQNANNDVSEDSPIRWVEHVVSHSRLGLLIVPALEEKLKIVIIISIVMIMIVIVLLYCQKSVL